MPTKKDNSPPETSSAAAPKPPAPVYEGFADVLSTLSNFRSQITMLQNQIRSLEKTVKKNMKTLQREAKKNRNKGNRKPSGFAVPTPISNELCDFMKRPRGSKVARTEVTQYIIRYIKEHDLQYQENRKIIKPNKALRSLLASKAKDEVTYFNIQRYMNRHFEKKKAAAAASTVASTVASN
jgi:chromatin remodeling complex protein RSC6